MNGKAGLRVGQKCVHYSFNFTGQECVVRVACLQEAYDADERFGIWGGLSERERRKLKKRAV